MCNSPQRVPGVPASAAVRGAHALHAGTPSSTAYRVALRRAAHQIADQPLVFADPLALRILGLDANGCDPLEVNKYLRAPKRPSSKGLRAFLVARARFAEDTVHLAVAAGVHQYVILGAGLDTFAYRNPYPQLTVFEVDHPSTQRWKRTLLRQANIPLPSRTIYVQADFQQGHVAECLKQAGFDPAQRTVFAWMGVVPYLQRSALEAMLQDLARGAAHSVLLMDYHLPRRALPAEEQLEFDSLAARVAATGEPFETWLEPAEARELLASHGWQVRQDLCRESINDRYFAGREDGLAVLRSGAHLVMAELMKGS